MRRTAAATGIALLLAGLTTTAATRSAAAPPPTGRDRAVAVTGALLSTHRAEISGSDGDAYQVYATTLDPDGSTHARYTRTYRGLRVLGGDLAVHAAPDGTLTSVGNTLTRPLALDTAPTVGRASAAAGARARFAGTVRAVGTPELVVDAADGTGVLAWDTLVEGTGPDGQTPSRLHVLSAAHGGGLLRAFDEIHTAAGTGRTLRAGNVTLDTTAPGVGYRLIDPVRGGNLTCDVGPVPTCTAMADADNTWGNNRLTDPATVAADAHYGAAVTWDYYKNVHGRSGIFNSGAGVRSLVHFGKKYANALWDGSQVLYGDGDGSTGPIISLDIAGHEMSHGVTEYSLPGGLNPTSESGALDEATSDIFGSMVEFQAANATDPGDYLIGEMLDYYHNGTPFRYMYNPRLDGSSDTCWSPNTAAKDPHFSSGVANHFFFDLAEGTGATPYGTSPVCQGGAVTGIGRTSAARIWYRALTVYFVSTTKYVNTAAPNGTARAFTLRAAADLYGTCSVEYRTVQAAWTSVNVAGPDAACPPPGDFSLAVGSQTGTVDPGGSTTVALTTTTTSGAPQTVNLSASGLPSGVHASFQPPSIPSDGVSVLTLAAAAAAPPGTYPLTLTGTGTAMGRAHSVLYTLTVRGSSGARPSPGQMSTSFVLDDTTLTVT
ncbi:M4 family metallopeptidase [Longispora sp. NPDC051575]|uniref:M4 family metallopeptidase n=1 Tax=Longispora sp. NPDC051575 TaxID=3154943 RepID=UPI00343A6A1C